MLSGYFKKAVTGQRNELEDEFKGDMLEEKWKKVALKATKSDCERCELSLSCPTFDHRKKFNSPRNDLTITNHDQLIVSVLNHKSEAGPPPIIPVEPGVVIIDEAHHFIENFLGQLEESFSFKDLKLLSKHISKNGKSEFLGKIKIVERELLKEKKAKREAVQGRYPISKTILRNLDEICSIVNQSLNELEATNNFNRFSQFNYKSDELERWYNQLAKFLSDKFVKWVDYESLKFSAISDSFPREFRELMIHLSRYNKIIVMSGTLTANGDFDSLINQWRLRKKEVITKRLDTPFDYRNQAMVYVPKDVTDPKEDGFILSGLRNINSLIALTGGRSLLLNTSKDHMQELWKDLVPGLRKANITPLLQGQSGVEKLTKQFRENETSVLVGSGSFFSGFSIPGSALVSVILTKLPFPVHDDPFLELIGQGYEGNEFFNFITQLSQ